MNYEAIIFDLDGVIIDTHRPVTEFWLRLAAAHQIQLSPADFQRDVYGCPADHTLQKLFPRLSRQEQEAVHALLQEYELNATYQAVAGVTTFIHALARWQIPSALVTSAFPWKTEIVRRQLGLDGLLTTQVTIADIQHGKPHPEGYLLAAQRLQKSPQQCIVFEDSVSGVRAAVAAGALCIGVRSPDQAPALIEAGAGCTIPDFTAVSLEARPALPEAGAPLVLRIQGGPDFPLAGN